MAYRFKLQTLLHYRQTLEDQAQLKLAREQQQLGVQEERLLELQERRQRTIDELERRKQKVMPAPLFSFFIDALQRTDTAIEKQQERIAAQEKIVASVRAELVERMRQRKVIDQLRNKDYAVYLRDSIRTELKENDEQVLLTRAFQENLLQGR